MAVEAQRGCGYRKVGGTYMVSGKFAASCDRLPFELDVCLCCGEGYRPSRSLRKITPAKMLQGEHVPCSCDGRCYICHPELLDPKAGHYLEWIGGSFYKDPMDFTDEAKRLGISRRLKSGIPNDLVVGKTVVFLAHRNTLVEKIIISQRSGRRRWVLEEASAIFSAFMVTRLEHICTQSEFDATKAYCALDPEQLIDHPVPERIRQLKRLVERGVILIPVPEDDIDHR